MEKKLFKKYLFLNYSRKFINSGKYHIVKSSVTQKGFVGVFIRSSGNSFKVEFDLKNKKVKHVGDYILNRGVDIYE